MNRNATITALAALVFTWFGCSYNSESSDTNASEAIAPIPVLYSTIVNFYPHDSSLYTEGFLIHDHHVFESTGSPENLPQTNSTIGTTNLTTGKYEVKVKLDKSKYFGEGIVFMKNKVYQLTYKNQLCFIYDAKSFKKIDSFKYANKEGWGFTTDGTYLIMSDGTDVLTFLDPDSLKPTKTLKITERGIPRDSINELEYIKGYIYANIWINNSIVKIDPSTGMVVAKIDFSFLMYDARKKNSTADVLNGIAYDSTMDKIYVTGKMWTNIYEVNFPH